MQGRFEGVGLNPPFGLQQLNFIHRLLIQWNPSIADTIGNQRGVPNSGASGVFPVGVVCVMELLSTTWLHFQRFPLLYAGKEG